MEQNERLSARELYDLAYRLHKANDNSSLMETCEILWRNFPDSNESKWASNRFKFAEQQHDDDCDKCGEKIPPIAAKCHCGGHRIPAPPKPPKPPDLPKIPPKKLVPCRVCEKEIATEAATCPHCGIAKPGSSEFGAAAQEIGSRLQKIALIVTAIMIFFAIAKCNAGS